MGLPCMNCGVPVVDADAKIFCECLLCPDCFFVAKRLYDQGQNELQQMLVTLKEILRVSIVRKQLTLPPPQEVDLGRGEIPQKKAIEVLVEMMKCNQDNTMNSSKNPLTSTARTKGVAGEENLDSRSTPLLPESPCIETLKTEDKGNA